ncbi:MAG: hypothetical protein GY768_05000, partial [Planctomycetaceae bacterium]|nr:hypothetical protein [Planctomycetaceae bacterium]
MEILESRNLLANDLIGQSQITEGLTPADSFDVEEVEEIVDDNQAYDLNHAQDLNYVRKLNHSPDCCCADCQGVEATPSNETNDLDQIYDLNEEIRLDTDHCQLPKEPDYLVQRDNDFYTTLDGAIEEKPGSQARLESVYGISDETLHSIKQKFAEPDQIQPSSETQSVSDSVPLPDTFLLHSNPTASKTIFLDFDGFTATGTWWNSSYGNSIVSPAYDPENDGAAFSSTELARIQRIWQRVAEDYAPFDVDVTTEDPGEAALVNTGGGDTEWGIRVVITVDDFANCGCGGFAYLDSFNFNYQSTNASDTPTYVFNSSEIGVSAAISHEVGHTLNLTHDGTTSANPVQPNASYYNGHGSGENSWGPIMGSGYYSNVTTWDSGEFYGANNDSSDANNSYGADDIDVIATENGFGLRSDDHGDDIATASSVTYPSLNSADPNLVDVALFGIIEDRNDTDFIKFATAAGIVDLTIESYAGRAMISNGDATYSTAIENTFYSTTPQNNQGSNLDVLATLYDSNGTVIAASNPTGLSASFSEISLAAGNYYLGIEGSGSGSPFSSTSTTGYTDYSSIGQYYVTGTVQTSDLYLSVSATSADKAEGNSGTTAYTFDILLTEAQTESVTVNWSATGSGTSPANAADFGGTLPSGQVTFLAGTTSVPFTVYVTGDSDLESDETFKVSLSDPTLGEVFNEAFGYIRSDDAELQGRVWNDQNNDGSVNAGETGASGITVYLDTNGNASLDSGEVTTITNGDGDYVFSVSPGDYSIGVDPSANQTQTFPKNGNGEFDPDDYPTGTILNSVDSNLTFAAIGNGVSNSNVTAYDGNFTTTGTLNFGNTWNGELWDTDPATLRIDFAQNVNEVSLDFISDDFSDFGHMRAYDSNDNQLSEVVTSDLGYLDVETMTITRSTDDIAYLFASGRNGQFGALDNLKYTFSGQGSPVPIQVSVGTEIADSNDFGVHTTISPGSILISSPSGLTTDELGSVVSFTIELDSEPTGDVTLPISSSDSTEGSVSPTSIVFTASNWNVPQTVTVTGVDDNLDDGDVDYSIEIGAASSSDENYNGSDPADINLTNQDDGDTAGMTVSSPSGLTTDELGSVVSFTIELDSEP